MVSELVEISGSLLHVVRTNTDGPSVIISSGMAAPWFHWDEVAARLSKEFAVTRFDRPGLGASPPEKSVPTLHREAARLAALAHHIDPANPVVLVAHSAAAFHAETLARLYPYVLCGLVLVDPSYEPDATPRTGIHQRVISGLLEHQTGIATAVRFTGITQLLGVPAYRHLMEQQSNHQSPNGDASHENIYRSTHVGVASMAEFLTYRDMALDLLALRAQTRFPAIPVRVLTATDGLSPDEAQQRVRSHAELAQLLRDSSSLTNSPAPKNDLPAHIDQTVLADSRHLVQLDRPDAIVAATTQVALGT